MLYTLDWKVGFCDSATEKPKELYSATVPGAVQLDYAKHYQMEDYRKGLNFKDYKWMEDKYWVYFTSFDASAISKDSNIFLVLKGVDYKYEILVNDNKICEYEGMYKKQTIDLSTYKGQFIDIKIIIYPVPKSTLPGVHKDSRDEANQCCKPAVSYGWDFHPRLIPIGIWDEAYICETSESVLSEPIFNYELSEDLKKAMVTLELPNAQNPVWKVYDPSNVLLFELSGKSVNFTIDDLLLWWCNGYGKPNLYTVSVYNSDQIELNTFKIGFKKIEIVKAEGSWDEGVTFPQTRNTPPTTVKLNNTVIFVKGTNWVAPEIFYGTIDYARYRKQLEMVKDANLNFVRAWGGSIINKESFFELCDELGILVWQEFPLACNDYIGTKHYLSVLESEAVAIIERIRNHACLMLWAGGNELFNNWSRMTDQHVALRLLNKLTYEYTPNIPFIPTSPLYGMGHGPYCFVTMKGIEVIEMFAESRNTAYTEFGGPGHACLETLKLIGDLVELGSMNTTNQIAASHSGAWCKLERLVPYFGEVEGVENQIAISQFVQSVGQSFIFEEARRQKPYCAMAANWCFNEPWPTVCNNSILSYPDYKKPAYYSIANACRSVLASARYRKLVYEANETLDFDVFLLNDSLEKVQNGLMKIYVQVGAAEKVCLLDWEYTNVKICENVIGPTVRYTLPYVDGADTLNIILECGEYSSKYTLLYRLPKKAPNAPRIMNLIPGENQV